MVNCVGDEWWIKEGGGENSRFRLFACYFKKI